MKKIFPVMLCVILMITGCRLGNDTTDQDATTQDTMVQADKPTADSVAESTLPYLAHYNDKTNQFEVKENSEYIPPANIENLLMAIGNRYPKIPLIIDHISNDTLYIKVPNATHLTQSMGTSGATAFLVEATYAFTTLQYIGIVNFEFDEGAHAVPGSYTRNSFAEFLK